MEVLRQCRLVLDAAKAITAECKIAEQKARSISRQAEQTIQELQEQMTKLRTAIEQSRATLRRQSETQ
jgi:hypothetical protein